MEAKHHQTDQSLRPNSLLPKIWILNRQQETTGKKHLCVMLNTPTPGIGLQALTKLLCPSPHIISFISSKRANRLCKGLGNKGWPGERTLGKHNYGKMYKNHILIRLEVKALRATHMPCCTQSGMLKQN